MKKKRGGGGGGGGAATAKAHKYGQKPPKGNVGREEFDPDGDGETRGIDFDAVVRVPSHHTVAVLSRPVVASCYELYTPHRMMLLSGGGVCTLMLMW